MFSAILLFLLFEMASLDAENPVFLSFYELESFDAEPAQNRGNHRRVNVRGFLYPTLDNQWILSSEPQLKSCCAGSIHKADQQIFIYFDPLESPPMSKQAITIEGVFVFNPIFHEMGNTLPKYRLEEARILPEKNHYSLWILVLALFIIPVLGLCYFLMRKRSRSL
jgi:hypothetical protein